MFKIPVPTHQASGISYKETQTQSKQNVGCLQEYSIGNSDH